MKIMDGPEQRSSWGNTSSNPQVLVFIPRPAANEVGRKFQGSGVNWTSIPLF